MHSTGCAGPQLAPLLEWMYDHRQQYSGNAISTRIQSLSIILKYRLPLFKTTSVEECLHMIKLKCKRGFKVIAPLTLYNKITAAFQTYIETVC